MTEPHTALPRSLRPVSVLAEGAARRLVVAGAACVALWVAVIWAMG